MFAESSTLISDITQHPGAAFPRVLQVVLVGAVVVIVLHLVLCLLRRRESIPRELGSRFQKLAYVFVLISVAVLGVTSFTAVLRFGVLEGWWLFVHMVGAGLFVVVLPIFAFFWGDASRLVCCAGGVQDDANARCCCEAFPKVMFWLLIASGFVVMGSMLLSMLPIFGTDGLHALLDVHRYSGLVAVVALILHLYWMMVQRLGLR